MTWTAPSKGGYSAKRGRKQGEPFPETPADVAAPAPVSDTRREAVARVRARAIRTADIWDASGDPVIEAWDGEQFTTADLRALAALPAPPVVDEAEIADLISARYLFSDPLTAPGIAAVVAARLRGATR